MLVLDITTFLGRLHPMIVHLPIGFLLLAVVFELLSYTNRYANLKPAVSLALLAGFIFAVAACVFGYLLSLSGDYDYQNLSNHKLSGIVVAVVSGGVYIMTLDWFRQRLVVPNRVFSVCFFSMVGLMIYTGHQGGNLTHGSDYLTLKTLQERERKKPASVDEALLYEDVVQPILANRCGQCHRDGKLKGELSVQSLPALLKGGKSGPAIVAGSLSKSILHERISMDPSNKKYMPADGKPPLTKDEAALITWWIEKGLAAGSVPLAKMANATEIKPRVAAWLGLGEGASGDPVAMDESLNPDIPLQLNPALIDSLRSQGFQVRVMSHRPVMLDVSLPGGGAAKLAASKTALTAVARHIIWLNLSRNGLEDKDLELLPLMTNLEKIRLEGNPLTDKVCDQLSQLPHLEAVNLNETKISAAAVEKLRQLPTLKNVYTWKTRADSSGQF